MNVYALAPQPAPEQNPHFWLGRLSYAMACAEAARDVSVQREALEAFLRSPVVAPEVRKEIAARRRK